MNIHETKLNIFSLTVENYNVIAKAIKILEYDSILQLKFLNSFTYNWALRHVYPDLPMIILNALRRLNYKLFDDLEYSYQEKIVNFFDHLYLFYNPDTIKTYHDVIECKKIITNNKVLDF
jgi:hypothetical protein